MDKKHNLSKLCEREVEGRYIQMKITRRQKPRQIRYITKCFCICIAFCLFFMQDFLVDATPLEPQDTQAQEEVTKEEAQVSDNTLLCTMYEEYQERFESIMHIDEIEQNDYVIDETQIFPMFLRTNEETEVTFLSAMDKTYHRLAVFIADANGKILYKTNQLETNFVYQGKMEQPTKGLASVSFQDVNGDGRTDIILLTTCVNETGEYAKKPYKVGDVLFQGEDSFYRDYRISDKINRFGMNRSANCITAFIRDRKSTEFLYTATTFDELKKNGFSVIEEQCYTRNFEKLGRLKTVPGVFRLSGYNIFMIYLVDGQGDIVWSFQPMEDYDNLYSLKGITGKDVDGDGMKDLVVLARYSREDEDGKQVVDSNCAIYYQRTGGFEEDEMFEKMYPCTDDDKVETLVTKIREYWGWRVEEE